VEKTLTQVYQTLEKLVGLHRQLLDTVRMERDALVQADKKGVEEAVRAKQAIIEAVRMCESERLKKVGELALLWKKPLRDLTLPLIIIAIQGEDPRAAEQLRGAYNALTILIQRITDQNNDNRAFVEKSLEHVHAMKRNVLGESVPKSNTYTQQGQKSNPVNGARLISKEA